MRVAVLGASPKPERYSHQAVALLLEHGHEVVPIRPGGLVICGCPALPSLDAVEGPLDVLTVYVNAARSTTLIPSIVAAGPERLILNPGAENPALAAAAEAAGIAVQHACTLVLLKTGQFGESDS